MDPSSSSSSSLARARARASSSSRASRSRAHLDDDERSPELIERETHRARPIVANSRRRASIRARRSTSASRTHPRSSACVFHRRWTDDCTERRVVHDRETKERRRGGPSPPYCNTVKRRVRRAKSDGRLWTWCMRAGGGGMWSRDPSNRHPC